MTTVFIDVDDTLVLYQNETKGIHPYGILHGEPYEPNTKLIEKLKSFDGDIIVWSGGGKEYARQVARMILLPEGIRCQAAFKMGEGLQVKEGDIIVDDQKDYYIGFKDLGIHVFGPLEDWNL